jgi:hypothetical protein
MQRLVGGIAIWLILAACPSIAAQHVYLGFDRDDYPGDSNLAALRKSFFYTSYWLNPPPGEKRNTWSGKRALLKQEGFGFLVLFNGRLDAELKGHDAAAMGTADGKSAAAAAAREGFAPDVLIFLDQEEGGRLLPEQAAYIFAWIDTARGAGARAGVYCSGIDVPEGRGTISTARDLVTREEQQIGARRKSGAPGVPAKRLALWVANDQCPPSPGCVSTTKAPSAGFPSADPGRSIVWQYAQSPRRAQFSASCPKNDDPNGNCYAPGLPHSAATFVDLDVADSPDPSEAP